ncbi:UNVERIFIED_CONTAM: hypothetical protein Sradi_5013600 [Sesamum radiatum]|uniref:Transmembrane protein n=1 Tax=Sesamum radiatum TaxID=300843 RepID=A0AAW2MFH9_SESRA
MRNRIEKALQTSRNKYKELTIIIHKQEKKVQFLETKALHLSMFYIASQLLIFLSNSKLSSSPNHRCSWNWYWKPFFVSLSITVVFGLNFTTTIIKYVRTKYEQDRNFIDQEENYQQMAFLERRHRTKDDSTGSYEVDMSKAYTLLKLQPDTFAVYQRYAHLGISIAVLLAFTALVLHTCRSSVCDDAPVA